jgi:hypothetical protein
MWIWDPGWKNFVSGINIPDPTATLKLSIVKRCSAFDGCGNNLRHLVGMILAYELREVTDTRGPGLDHHEHLRAGLRIRIQSGQWIRIRIRNPDPDPDPGGKNDPRK